MDSQTPISYGQITRPSRAICETTERSHQQCRLSPSIKGQDFMIVGNGFLRDMVETQAYCDWMILNRNQE